MSILGLICSFLGPFQRWWRPNKGLVSGLHGLKVRDIVHWLSVQICECFLRVGVNDTKQWIFICEYLVMKKEWYIIYKAKIFYGKLLFLVVLISKYIDYRCICFNFEFFFEKHLPWARCDEHRLNQKSCTQKMTSFIQPAFITCKMRALSLQDVLCS